MSNPTITAEKRTGFGRRSVAALRERGRVPVVVMRSGEASEHLVVEEKELANALAGGRQIVDVSVDGAVSESLVKEVQRHPVSDAILHLDLLAVTPDKVVKTDVPVVADIEGSPGIKAGGMLEVMLRRVTVSCPVKDLPPRLQVSLSGAGIGHTVYVRDVRLPPGVRILQAGRTALMSILKTRGMKKAEAEGATEGDEAEEGAEAPAEGGEGPAEG